MDTILQLLDDLEKEIESLRSPAATAQPGRTATIAPLLLWREMERASLTAAELCRIADVSREEVEDWLAGAIPTPAWVLITLQLAALLAPSVRRKLLRQPLGQAIPAKPTTHPFSRIKDL